MSFLIPTAWATTPVATPPALSSNSTMSSVMMFALFGLFIYLFMWRPQNKRIKAHQAMIVSLKTGDEIITTGGLLGKIVHLEDNLIKLALTKETIITVQKVAIASVLPNGTIKDQ